MAVKGVKVGVSNKLATLPITGCFLAKSKQGNSLTLYIDHYTSAEKKFRVYKPMPIITMGDPKNSIFLRPCAAFKVSPNGLTMRQAAMKLADAIASKGAITCERVGKGQDWVNITAIDFDSEALPFSMPAKDGLLMESLWQVADQNDEPTSENNQVDDGAWDVGDI